MASIRKRNDKWQAQVRGVGGARRHRHNDRAIYPVVITIRNRAAPLIILS